MPGELEANSLSWDDVDLGDRVTIELTGEYQGLEQFGRYHIIAKDDYGPFQLHTRHAVTIKSIVKPVRPFKPGDVVRAKPRTPGAEPPDSLFTIGVGRFYDHDNQEWCDWTLSPTYYELVE